MPRVYMYMCMLSRVILLCSLKLIKVTWLNYVEITVGSLHFRHHTCTCICTVIAVHDIRSVILVHFTIPSSAVYNQFKQTEKEKSLFSLKGSKNADKRMTLYTFLLSHMADEHRFQLTARLCQVKGRQHHSYVHVRLPAFCAFSGYPWWDSGWSDPIGR